MKGNKMGFGDAQRRFLTNFCAFSCPFVASQADDLPDLGKPYASQPIAALCDGSVRVLNVKHISAETLKRAICPNDGMVLGDDW